MKVDLSGLFGVVDLGGLGPRADATSTKVNLRWLTFGLFGMVDLCGLGPRADATRAKGQPSMVDLWLFAMVDLWPFCDG